MNTIFTRKSLQLFAILFISIVTSFYSTSSKAQAPSITFPVNAQNVTKGSGSSLLTVKIKFFGLCNDTVLKLGGYLEYQLLKLI
jgi:hypothetical protein